MDDDERDHYREAARSYFDSCAGDDLTRMANEVAHLRDFLIGQVGRFAAVNEETILHMAYIEEGLREMFAERWEKCQDALENASDEELEETDTEWMGKPMPDYFSDMTVEKLRGLMAKARQPRIPTNPATLISMGALDEA